MRHGVDWTQSKIFLVSVWQCVCCNGCLVDCHKQFLLLFSIALSYRLLPPNTMCCCVVLLGLYWFRMSCYRRKRRETQQGWQTSAVAMHLVVGLGLARLLSMSNIFCLLPISNMSCDFEQEHWFRYSVYIIILQNAVKSRCESCECISLVWRSLFEVSLWITA